LSKQSYLSIDDFFSGITGSAEDLALPGLGTVRVRSLEAIEVQQIRAQAGDNEMEMSFLSIIFGMVEPALSREHLEQLHRAKPGIVATITRRIMELSGMVEDSEKKAGSGS
jgi:hypothetical protein